MDKLALAGITAFDAGMIQHDVRLFLAGPVLVESATPSWWTPACMAAVVILVGVLIALSMREPSRAR